jgi:hypothetical protein
MTPKLIERLRSALLVDPAATRTSVKPPTMTSLVTCGSLSASAAGKTPSATIADPIAPAASAHQHAVEAQR